jgi:hypothetical protein
MLSHELYLQPLIRPRQEPCATTTHPLAGRGQIPLRALREEPMVTLTGASKLCSTLETACQAAGFVPRIVAETSHLGVMVELAAGQLGVAVLMTRRVGPRKLPATEEITELKPPRIWAVRAVGGPLIAIAKGTIEPLDDGKRSRLTIALEFHGHGIGRLLVPLVIRRQARRQLPKNQQQLKEVLERGA